MIKKSIRLDKREKIERRLKKDQEEKERQEKERRQAQNAAAVGNSSVSHRKQKGLSKRSDASKGEVQNRVQQQLERKYEEKVIRETLEADPDLQFDNPQIYTYDRKLEQLYEFEDELLHVDRVQKENRRGL